MVSVTEFRFRIPIVDSSSCSLVQVIIENPTFYYRIHLYAMLDVAAAEDRGRNDDGVHGNTLWRVNDFVRPRAVGPRAIRMTNPLRVVYRRNCNDVADRS